MCTCGGRGPKSIFCHPPPDFWDSLFIGPEFTDGLSCLTSDDSGNLSVSVVPSSPSPQHCGYKNELSCLAFYLGSEIWTQVLMLTCKSLSTQPSPISPVPLLWVSSLCVFSASFHLSQALGDKLGILLLCISGISHSARRIVGSR